MSLKTFPKGGTHLHYHKELAEDKAIEVLEPPQVAVIPLHQHTGAPNNAIVKKGDRVLVGQKIGTSDAFISAPVHSSISGEVIDVEMHKTFTGANVSCVVIASDGKQTMAEFKGCDKDIADITPDEIRNAVKEAGIVGLGGAAFPTHVKLTPPKDKPIDSVIINGAECEPFLCCDYRNMLERTEDLIYGTKLCMKAVGANKAYIGIEANKPQAISLLTEKTKGDNSIEVISLAIKYPQGAEKALIKTILNREVPPGKLPSEVGALVQNVGTTIAIAEAVKLGKPLYERVLTVTGNGVKNPKNLLVKIGTKISLVINSAGGLKEDVGKVIVGGPMTGWAQSDLNVPVVKGTSGIVAFLKNEVVGLEKHMSCVRCGKCVSHCPMGLMPNFIGIYSEVKDWKKAEAYGAMDCYECGVCAYTCPAKRPLIKLIREAKGAILAAKKKTA